MDARLIASSGIGRYTRSLLRNCLDQSAGLRIVALGDPGILRECFPDDLREQRLRIVPFTAPLYSVREQIEGALVFSRVAADAVFFPHYTVPLIVRRPFVVTVHDLTHLRFPEAFGRVRSRVAAVVMGRAIRRARRVLADCHAARRDIEAYFPETHGKLAVVPCGVDPIFQPASPEEVRRFLATRSFPERYVLSVGNRKPHKNLRVAGRAMRMIRDRHPGVAWIVVGRRFTTEDDVSSARELLGSGLIEMENVTDSELRHLYAGATALLMPSRWEGFGLPALEAMACGTVVVASAIPPLQELVGDAGVLCPPDDPAGFASGLLAMIQDPTARAARVQRGFARARGYGWERAATVFLQELEESLRV